MTPISLDISIVTYKTDLLGLKIALISLCQAIERARERMSGQLLVSLFIVENAPRHPTPAPSRLAASRYLRAFDAIHHVQSPTNVGFGRGHKHRVVCRERVTKCPRSGEQPSHGQSVYGEVLPHRQQPLAIVRSDLHAQYEAAQGMCHLGINEMRCHQSTADEGLPGGVLAEERRNNDRRVDDDQRSRPERTAATTSSMSTSTCGWVHSRSALDRKATAAESSRTAYALTDMEAREASSSSASPTSSGTLRR